MMSSAPEPIKLPDRAATEAVTAKNSFNRLKGTFNSHWTATQSSVANCESFPSDTAIAEVKKGLSKTEESLKKCCTSLDTLAVNCGDVDDQIDS